MNFKRLAFAAVAAVSIAAPTASHAQIDRKTIETVAALLLADKLGLDASTILQTSLGANASVYDMAPAFAMQRYAPKRSATSIWEMRQQGMGWGEIAKAVGMQPGEFNKLRNSGQLDSNNLWRSRYENRFGLAPAQIDDLRKMGLTWRDIGIATVIAREAGTNVYDVARRYTSTRNWDRVASQFNVSGSKLTSRVNNWRSTRTVPSNWRTATVVKSKSKSSGSASQKMKGHSVSHSKSSGKGHDKHHDAKTEHGKHHDTKSNHGKSNGKGKGKGKQ